MADLEEKLIQDLKTDGEVSLEGGLLIVSGLRTEGEVEEYTLKLTQIHNGFLEKLKKRSQFVLSTARQYTVGQRARFLFEYLWNTKPKRCNGSFLLTDVIDAQLDPDIDRRVGQCVGLTSLYTVLGLREDLNLTIFVNSEHITNRLRVGETVYNIENTDSLGFDCDLDEGSFVEYPLILLLAHVLNSRGMAKEKADNLEGALEDYGKAIEIHPEYANAYNNSGNMKSRLRDYEGALTDYDEAINLDSELVEAYCNRGIAKDNLGDHAEAIKDFNRSIELYPKYADAYMRRASAKKSLGDDAGAEEDFDKVIELNS